jgi:hypothetical protein
MTGNTAIMNRHASPHRLKKMNNTIDLTCLIE